MKITTDGLHAGIQDLNERCDGFDIGTGDDYHIPFMCALLKAVFHASGIEIDIDEETPRMQTKPLCEDHQDTLPSAALVVFLAAEHLESEADRRLLAEVNGSNHFVCCSPFPRTK